MSFDFAGAVKDAQKDLTNSKVFLLLLGASGNGKSYALGTFGVKTLYLYTQGESHGPKSAKTQGAENIVPVCIDRDGEKELTPDLAIKRLHTILDDAEGIKKAGFGAIALDGASELEAVFRDSERFKIACLANGKHNGFAEGPVTLGMFREVLVKLKKLQRELQVHVAMTCILEVKEMSEDGTIESSSPSLQGYMVATGLVRNFDDVMIIGRMQAKGHVAYRLQLLAAATKVSADFKTKEIKKTFNFSPRLNGVDITAAGGESGHIKADLSKLAELKAGKDGK